MRLLFSGLEMVKFRSSSHWKTTQGCLSRQLSACSNWESEVEQRMTRIN